MRSLFGLEGKSFLVVGGGQGMGEATVRLLASLGADVAVADIELERAERVAADVAKGGVTAVPIRADVMQEAGAIEAVAAAERGLGGLDGMATVVGAAAWAPILDMTAETWELDHNRNLRHFFFVARETARTLRRLGRPGTIAAVCSVDGLVSSPQHASYGAAKAGLVNLVRSMALEWAEYGIRVNAVAPGGIVTPRLPLTDPEGESRSMAALPMRRRGMVDDIAKGLVYFLSDMSPYVTGQTLAVDGGYVATGIFNHKPSVSGGATLDATKD